MHLGGEECGGCGDQCPDECWRRRRAIQEKTFVVLGIHSHGATAELFCGWDDELQERLPVGCQTQNVCWLSSDVVVRRVPFC